MVFQCDPPSMHHHVMPGAATPEMPDVPCVGFLVESTLVSHPCLADQVVVWSYINSSVVTPVHTWSTEVRHKTAYVWETPCVRPSR